ncbi:MAG: F0F1 ATP synthase subunit delta, partial [Niabella sp.]
TTNNIRVYFFLKLYLFYAGRFFNLCYDAIKNSIIAQVKKAAGVEKVELEEKVNPDIIGGFVLEMGDKMVDASIAYDLRAVAKQFKNNDFIYRVR